MVEIIEISEASNEILSQVNGLLPQLSKSASPLSLESLDILAKSESTNLFVAKEGKKVWGMLSLVLFPIPTGTKAWVEDVVVDSSARGKGIGKALMNHALKKVREKRGKSIDLTSRPSRETANKLYQSLGYQKRETNVYRLSLS
ncbi:MAG: GNAT family N-acetyltransferase [Verrucomicrobiota bacterium]|jgi:ribosomal protein S18 acetylase RimI-like enzyme|nr:GNAT family N-acetyltransferase [Opitutae bacterium]MBO25373.1 GNAT family N-acetyltransferase [Opitutales bacterium]MEC7395034.1 GNAT family N-acetyltransferase [Verrucomicrobiota bacterium]MEC7542870.1 GNAT family N-acetyltransferase [Verrucomicrobiota bacterium]MEC7627929.1 GNAT family N-acetyltransferase [Verrucomicrobiota bacterium]|tara:strand:+ start:3377 stop:3808 length:432 start_codon:yes stop_codon:yes gene_type:complete